MITAYQQKQNQTKQKGIFSCPSVIFANIHVLPKSQLHFIMLTY